MAGPAIGQASDASATLSAEPPEQVTVAARLGATAVTGCLMDPSRTAPKMPSSPHRKPLRASRIANDTHGGDLYIDRPKGALWLPYHGPREAGRAQDVMRDRADGGYRSVSFWSSRCFPAPSPAAPPALSPVGSSAGSPCRLGIVMVMSIRR